MGLERIAAVMQGVHDNYELDVFKNIYSEFFQILKTEFKISEKTLQSEDAKIASRLIADHIRSAVFLIAEGVFPSNERTGYVLRSIIRRAVYYLYRFGAREPLFFKFIYPLLIIADVDYPDLKLKKQESQIINIITQEEEQFLNTLDRGVKILEQELSLLKGKLFQVRWFLIYMIPTVFQQF